MPAKRAVRGLPLPSLLLAALVVAAGLPAGCGADDPEISSPVTAHRRGQAETAEAAAVPVGVDGAVLVAEADDATLEVWASPAESPTAEHTLEAADEPSRAIVMLVKQELGPTWIEVYLPTAPPGSTGWVRRDEVSLSQHRFRIEVDRSDHVLTLYTGRVKALEAPVGIGTSDAPYDGAGLYIKDLVETPRPDGPYGRYAYGLSGASNRVENFEAASGVVAIHGTADPAMLGRDMPLGSLAVSDDALDRMVNSIGVPLGTPVTFVG